MLSDPNCPVCETHDWEVLGERTYWASDLPRLDVQTARQYHVLLELWFPGETEVTLQARMCCACGFILYTPRPTEEELERQYRYLAALEANHRAGQPVPARETRRARAVLRHLAPYLRSGQTSVLDYGGGDGHLLLPILARGCRCAVVDYRSDPIPGVQWLGSTLRDLPADAMFDVIVCTHVLEHLADPFGVARGLREHLCETGILYVEVPMEVWLGAALQRNPIVHVNFFTLDSLRFLLERAGYEVIRHRLAVNFHLPSPRQTVIWMWAKRSSKEASKPPPQAVRNVRRLLSPDAATFARMAMIRPDWVWKYAWNRILGR